MKRIMKVVLALSLALMTAVAFTACGGSSSSDSGDATQGDTYTIKIGHTMSEEHSYQAACESFKNLVEEKSGGRITVEVYPNGQLGAEREMIEAVQGGTLECVVTGTSALSGFVPEWQVFDMAYLFKDADEMFKVLDGEIGDKFRNEYCGAANFVGLGNGCMGIRNVHSTKAPINSVEDMKGLKIRVMESNVHIKTFKALGANPVTMAFSELFTALEQGTVDAEEATVSGAYTSKTSEVCKYYSRTEHFFLPCILLGSKTWMDGLSEEDQALMKECGAQACKDQWQAQQDADEADVALIEEGGDTINELSDEALAEFRELAHGAYEDILKDVPDGAENMDAMSEFLGRDMYEVW